MGWTKNRDAHVRPVIVSLTGKSEVRSIMAMSLFLWVTSGILQGMEKDAQKLKERDNLMENAGKLLVDLGKLIFDAIALGGILRGELPQVTTNGQFHCSGLDVRRGTSLDVQGQGKLNMGMEILLIGIAIVVVPIMIMGFVVEWRNKKARK